MNTTLYVAADQNIHLHCVECAFESLVYDRFMNKYEKVTFRKWAKCEEQGHKPTHNRAHSKQTPK